MSNLRAAAQQALEALRNATPGPIAGDDDYAEGGWALHRKAISALRAALSAEHGEQEPVAWRIRRIDPVSDWTLIYQRSTTGEKFPNMEIQSLYTHPPSQRSENLKSREWRGLTEDEIYPLYSEPNSDAEMVEFARAIEAALKEKNQ